MASTSRRTVLTGVGVLNPLGIGADAYWRGLLSGRSGIRTISNFNTSALPTRIGAEIVGFDARKFLDKKAGKQLRVMARGIQLAVAAAQLALDQGRVDKDQLDPTRFGVEFGAGFGHGAGGVGAGGAIKRQLSTGPDRSGKMGRGGHSQYHTAVDAQIFAQYVSVSHFDFA